MDYLISYKNIQTKIALVALASFASLFLFAHSAHAAPATFTVTNTNDSGAGSLRDAIDQANGNGNPADMDVIEFNIPGSGVHTIQIASDLPGVTEKATIDGYSQPGASANSASSPNPFNGTILIEIAGTNATMAQGIIGLVADDSILQGLALYDGSTSNFDDPKVNVALVGAGTKIRGCYVGLRADGATTTTFDRNQIGVSAVGANVVVGGTSASDRNILFNASSSNKSAAFVAFAGTATFYGNYVGLAKDGVTDLTPAIEDANGLNPPFSFGMNIISDSGTVVGGPLAGQRNVISGNDANVVLSGADVTVQGNYIGTDYTGQPNSGITNGMGITAAAAHENLIGGSAAGEGNTIAGVRGSGIEITSFYIQPFDYLISPNRISVLRNSIFGIQPFTLLGLGNSNLGIDLSRFIDSDGNFLPDSFADRGPTLNDSGDPDIGPNGFMNYPVLKSAQQVGNQLTITYDLDVADSPSNTYRVEFYANDESTIFGHGPGQTYLGAAASVTPGTNKSVTLTVNDDQYKKSLSATTTAIDGTSGTGFGSTSEFSQNISIGSSSDFDADGIADAVENQAPNNGDGNNDGTPDRLQPTVTTLEIDSTGKWETFVTTGCSDNGSVTSIDTKTLARQDTGKTYPYGLTDFSLNCSRGDTVNVTKYVFVDDQPTSYSLRKYNDITDTYRDVPGSSIGSEQVGSAKALVARYSITDGGELDDDGSANGVIVDPVGLATTASLADTGTNVWVIAFGALSLLGTGLWVGSRAFVKS